MGMLRYFSQLQKRESELENRFTYHKPIKPLEQAEKYELLRSQFRANACNIVSLVPPGRELEIALGKLEEAMMWSNAGIARGENYEGVKEREARGE